MSEDIAIKIHNVTRDYGKGRGIFDIDLEVKRGEVYGLIGTNGSGKTTTIRHIMGFIKPQTGYVEVNGLDSWYDSVEIKKLTSYVPGEISFPPIGTGVSFFKSQMEFLGIKDGTYRDELVQKLRLDPTAKLKAMSKGMKQKTALVAALLQDADIMILDEPTTGLDPLMRDEFLNLIRQEKRKGKTIFMSDHIFEEVENVCDRAALIMDGRIIDVIDINEMHNSNNRRFTVTFNSPEAAAFADACPSGECTVIDPMTCDIRFARTDVDDIMDTVADYDVQSLREIHETVEDRFRQAFNRRKANDE